MALKKPYLLFAYFCIYLIQTEKSSRGRTYSDEDSEDSDDEGERESAAPKEAAKAPKSSFFSAMRKVLSIKAYNNKFELMSRHDHS